MPGRQTTPTFAILQFAWFSVPKGYCFLHEDSANVIEERTKGESSIHAGKVIQGVPHSRSQRARPRSSTAEAATSSGSLESGQWLTNMNSKLSLLHNLHRENFIYEKSVWQVVGKQ